MGSISRKIIVIFILVASVLTVASIYTSYYVNLDIVTEEVNSHLESVAQLEGRGIEVYIEEEKTGLRILANTIGVKQIVSVEVETDPDPAKIKVESKAKEVASEIESYLEKNPEMTVEDLQNDSTFQEIAVQEVGETGYTAVHEQGTLINRFHPGSSFVNMDLNTLKEDLPIFYSIVDAGRNGDRAAGSYFWQAETGAFKKKYMHIEPVNVETADGVKFSVATTTYLSEFSEDLKVLSDSETFISQFKELRDYEEIALVNTEGELVWSTIGPELSCTAKLREGDKTSEIYKSYEDILSEKKPAVSSIHPCGINDTLKLHIGTPVFNENETVAGILFISLDNRRITRLIDESLYLGETEDVYLVGPDLYLKSPSRFIKENYSEQKINTPGVRNCFSSGESAESDRVSIYENYRGKDVLGAHRYLPELDLCLMVEQDEEEALGVFEREMAVFGVIRGILVISLAVIASVLFSKYFSKPIIELTEQAKKIEKGDFKSARTNINTGDEIEKLGRVFNTMASSLEKTEEQRKEIDKEKTRLLSITSHELRSPMTPVKAQLQMLLKEKYGKLNKEQKKAMEIVLRNAERLDQIIAEFLDVSRIEAARLKWNFKKTDLNEHIDNLIKMMKGFMPEKKVKIENKVPDLPEIETDPDRIMQVLRNLINNAIKFSKKGGKVTVSAEDKGSKILFSVKDRGIGMSKEEQRRVFEPFYQAEQSIYREQGGTGLGLAICRGIVESQEGKIWIESRKGNGSTFYFTIPKEPVKETKPIKLLFSPQKKIEDKLEEIFEDVLGPLGGDEFEKLREEKEITKKTINEYVKELKKEGILDKEGAEELLNKASSILEEKEGKKVTESELKELIKEKEI